MGYSFFKSSGKRRATASTTATGSIHGSSIGDKSRANRPLDDESQNSGSFNSYVVATKGDSGSIQRGTARNKERRRPRGSSLSPVSKRKTIQFNVSEKETRYNGNEGDAANQNGNRRAKLLASNSARSNSSKSWISDLDVESGELASTEVGVIGESVQEETEAECNQTTNLPCGYQKQNHQTYQRLSRNPSLLSMDPDVSSRSDEHSSCEFTLAKNTGQPKRKRRLPSAKTNSNSNLNSNSNDQSVNGEISSFAGTASVMMDRDRAVNYGRSGTRFVYAVLLFTALLLSVATFLFVQQSEQREFESEFHSYAREAAGLAETNADHAFSQFQTLATTLTSSGLLEEYHQRYHYTQHPGQARGLDENSETGARAWPNVTIAHFDERIVDASESAGAIMTMYVPLVQSKDRDGFEAYANLHAPWRKPHPFPHESTFKHAATASLSSSDIDKAKGNFEIKTMSEASSITYYHNHPEAESEDGDSEYIEIHPCIHVDTGETRDGFVDVDSFLEEILREKGGFPNPDGMSAPVYQYGGPNHDKEVTSKDTNIALMDLWTHPIFKKEVVASIEYDVPVITEHMNVDFLLQSLSTATDTAAEDSGAHYHLHDHTNEEEEDLVLESMTSLTLDPVKESFDPGARTIGFVVGIVPWSTFFRNVLEGGTDQSTDDDDVDDPRRKRREINGIVVKVISDCGSVFTFVLNSGNRENPVRLGDWKEQYGMHQDVNHTSRFFFKEHPKGQSRHCHFDLHIYPNQELRDRYLTNQPFHYALAVIGIFLFTTSLFACYDAFVFKGQRHIVTEATAMIVENARRAAMNERDLNDFIAHEVRNPLAAAISACAFVSSAITEDERRSAIESDENEFETKALISVDEKRKEVQGDIKIIDSSLHFINDLLGNMLDMQRAGSNQISFDVKPTDIMNDIFKPVEAMMHLRDVPFEVILECGSSSGISSDGNAMQQFDEDDHLVIMTDPLRLKQVVLNLTSNAIRFVERGFIRCGAKVNPDTGFVELYVDDSGPGIPEAKRGRLFGKYQQSLDSLEQGTGIGLSLCKKMVDLMNGNLFVDDDYRSGIKGYPGTRFVIQLKIPPLELDNDLFEDRIAAHNRARQRRQLHFRSKQAPSESASKTKPLTPAMTNSIECNERAQTRTTEQTSGSSIGTESTLTSSENTGKFDQSSNAKDSDGNKIMDSIIHPMGVEEPPKEQNEPPPVLLPTPNPTATATPTALPLPPAKPQEIKEGDSRIVGGNQKNKDHHHREDTLLTELPENLSVLFVDDDMILRKLFSRTLKKANPTWTLREASSGEAAIELLLLSQHADLGDRDDDGEDGDDEQCGFDLIFMDQYMASVQKQLLGTETVRAIRAKGFHSPIICGLSANDVEEAFYHAGSDAFMFKPFPCKHEELKKELLRIINARRHAASES